MQTKSPKVLNDVAQRDATGSTGLNDEVDLRDVLRTLWRHKMVVFGTIVAITALSIVVVFQLTSLYTAETRVVIEPRETKVVDIEAVMSGLPANQSSILTEVEMLQSESLVGKVVDQLRLTEDPEFNKDVPSTAQERRPEARAEAIENFLRRLTVSPLGRSYVISIQFESADPRKAALITNTLADHYLTEQLEIKFDATRRATEWLSQRLGGLRQKMLEGQRAAEAYREEMGLIDAVGPAGVPVSITAHQISELNRQIIAASADRAEAEARLRKIQGLLRSPKGVESAAEVLASPLIQRLREQEAIIIRKEAELATRYGDRHPKMINVQAEIRDLRRKIQVEVAKIVQGLKNRVEVARSRETSLQESMKRLKGGAAEENRVRIRLKELERQAEANRVLYETFLSRFQETSTQENFQQPDARVVSTAQVPVRPSFPNKPLIAGLAFVGSVFLGVLLVVVLENLRSGVYNAQELQSLFGVRALGLVPTLRGVSKRRRVLEDFVLDEPTSAYSEAIRSQLTWLSSLNADRPPKVVLVTSAIAEEGKTTFCVSLARAAARAGKRTLLIDCDLRQRAKESSIEVGSQRGLVELLSDTKSVDEVVQKDGKSDMHFIRKGAKCSTPSDLLDSQKMKDLLTSLSAQYELTVLDSPPVLAASDARILSRMADKTVFLMRWGRTSREAAFAGLKEITDAGGDVAGVVLTQANLRKIGSYGYSAFRPYYERR